MRVVSRLITQIWRIQTLLFGMVLLAIVVSELHFLGEKFFTIGSSFFSDEFGRRLVRLYHLTIYSYFGVIIGRYVKRFLPVHFTGGTLRRRLSLTGVAGTLVAVFIGTLSPWAVGDFYLLFPGVMYYVALISVISSKELTAVHGHALFLRRFGFDRLLFGAVMGAIPAGSRMLCLIPTDEPVRSWDPLHSALVGLRILAPIQSSPGFIRSSDTEWINTIKSLAASAKVIVIDLSQVSESIRIELGILKSIQALERTLILLPDRNKNLLQKLSNEAGVNIRDTLSIITYRYSWRTSWFKIANGFLLLVAASATLVVTEAPFLFSLYMMVNLVSAFFVLFVKKAIDKRAQRDLKKAIQKATASHPTSHSATSLVARVRVFFLGHRRKNDEYFTIEEGKFPGRAIRFLLLCLMLIYVSHNAWFAWGPLWLVALWFSCMTFDHEDEIKGSILFGICSLLPILLYRSLDTVRG
ncbi:MAG: hypothetical protein MN733_36065 [Nitrososphaera sp.]|nr:hypothetical protein [Nitrososphaera sp.]